MTESNEPASAGAGDVRARPSAPWQIVERDDGLFEIGLCPDAPGPFESRNFALAVATKEATHVAS
jgi:hypothetical protein